MSLTIELLKKCLLLPGVLLFLTGCMSVDNNYLAPEEFRLCLEQEGLKVESVRKLPPDPFRATSACAFLVAGSEIGLYKYDQNSEIQQKRLARIAQEKCTYIIGVKYPVAVRGSFMLFGLDRNPQKRAILRAFDKFN